MIMDKQYVLARLKEQSTWRSFGIALGAFGIVVDEESIVAIGMGVSAIIGIFFPG